ncbi:flavodoxin-dependent (E)-4-hydroxy-3-methylbut-2-enyl-diphosphate synthase [Christensenellaceae bacterium OttesenSCG-928-K19]|nr:flavodoxin-dependent (E)-4-hydroxy-3-methylbut-2-enyl-diphosphate synthase [Christensenellaceae bacterium OttesenSCG-928-K19]
MDTLKNTRVVTIGDVAVGGGNKMAIQSMTNTDTKKVQQTVNQILALESAGCDIVRSAIYDMESAKRIPKIKEQIHIPFVADVHFDHEIAIAAIEYGADKIRINPGNIGDEKKIKAVVDAAKTHGIPIRVGANAGSLSKAIMQKYGAPSADALVESAMGNIRILEKSGFHEIVVSIKSSSAPVCVEAYRKISKLVDYPLHLGVTEAGTYKNAIIKSAIGLGTLVLEGIGDTMRVSITGDPVQEIYAARDILKNCGVKLGGVEIISCPTCARCSLDIEKIANSIESFTQNLKVPMKVAIMGCAVNGPGEAKEADVGIAGGRNEALLFSRGKIIHKVDEFDILPELKRLIMEFQQDYAGKY